MHDHPVLQVMPDPSRKNRLLHVAAESHHIIPVTTVTDTDNILLDDRAFIQVFRHVVAGRTDQLYTPVIGFLVRVGADK